MSFIDSIKRYFTPTSYYVGFTQFGSIRNVFNNDHNNSAINICSRVIANTVASIPIVVYKDVQGFKEVVKDDFRYRTLHNNPNGYTTAFSFWHTMELTKQINGNSFAIIHKFSNPAQIILEFAHPSSLVDKPKFVKGFLKYTFSTDTGNKTYDASEIIHFKRDSIDGIMGIDPHTILCEEIKRTFLANKTITNYYENDGKSTKFIETSGQVAGNKAQIDEGTDRFRKEAGGAYYDEKGNRVTGNFDKIVSFPRLPGNSKIQVIPNDQNDALYLATIEKADLNIAAHYQIPPHYLNIMQAQKNNNVETLQIDFKSSTIQHILRSNRQELEMKLLTTKEIDDEMSIEYNAMAVLELNHDTRMKGYESLQKTARMSANEVRKLEGMEPIEGGDVHPIFDQMTSIEQLNKPDVSVN